MEEKGIASLPLYPEERSCRAPTTCYVACPMTQIERSRCTFFVIGDSYSATPIPSFLPFVGGPSFALSGA
jgi:hypothetical protein